MQVAPLRGQPGLKRVVMSYGCARCAERSSPGNDNKPGSPSALCAQPVLPKDTVGWGLDAEKMAQETGQCQLVSPPWSGLARFVLFGAAVLFSERQVASDKGQAAGLQLGARE